MEQRRIVGVLAAIAAEPQGPLADRLCSAAQQQLDASGVGLSLAVSDDLLESVAATKGARNGESLQATGVVSVQLGIDVGTDLAVLRARAFANDQSLRDLASDIVARRVRVDE